MEYNIIYLIGILLTFLVSAFNLYLTLINRKRTTFIGTITSSRIKYIQEIRTHISEFCGLIYSYNLRLRELSDEDSKELERQTDRIKYLILLYLNPEDEYWDKRIISLLDELTDISLIKNESYEKIKELMILTQYLLKLEWEGAKLESEKGILSQEEKKELCLKYENLHKNFIYNQHKQESEM